MIQQPAGHFTRNAQKATEIVDDKLPDRQRGMWSFLTWSFFLAQAVAAHEAFAKGHGAGDGSIEDAAGHDGSADAAQKALAPGMMSGVSGFDIDPTAAAQFAAAIAAGAVTPQMFAAFQADPSLIQAFLDALTGGGTDHINQVFLDAAFADGQPVAGAIAADAGSHGDTPFPSGPISGLPIPGIHLPIDIAIDLGLELGPDLGLGLNIGHDGIGLDLNAGSLLNLGLNLGGEGEPLNLSLLGLNVLGGEHGLIGLTGDNGLLPLGPALAPVIELTGLASNALSGPLDLTKNIVTALSPVAAPVTSLVDDVVGTVGSSGLLASGGSIVQTATSLPLLNDLFQHGQHTDYGVELRSASTSGDDHAHGNATASVETFDVLAIAGHAGDAIGDIAGHVLPSVIEELNLRGFGDGFA